MRNIAAFIILMFFMDNGVASLSTTMEEVDMLMDSNTAIKYIIHILMRVLDYLIIYIISRDMWGRRSTKT